MESLNSFRWRRIGLWGAFLGVFLAGQAVTTCMNSWNSTEAPQRDFSSLLFPSLNAQGLLDDLGEGNYFFLPTRRTIWVVNRDNGRMVNYEFIDNEFMTVQKSRVARIDQVTFPPDESSYLLSDRNWHSIIWVCNRRTGDVQLWELVRDGEIRKVGPIATSANLNDVEPQGR